MTVGTRGSDNTATHVLPAALPTLGAGDWLKERLGCRVLVAEALECPTLLYNGYQKYVAHLYG